MKTEANPQPGSPADRGSYAEPSPGSPASGASAAAAWRIAFERLGELAEYAGYYVAAKVDSLKLTARRIGIAVALGVIGLVALVTLAVMMMVLLTLGIAGAFQALTGSRWLADIITFAIIALVLVSTVWAGMRAVTGASRKRTVNKYERRQHQQRVQYGADVQQRAEAGCGSGRTD